MNLKTLIDKIIFKCVRKVRVSMPAKIERVDASTGLLHVKVSLVSIINKKEVEQPIIVSVPTVFPRSETSSFSFPLKRGDEGLLIFADRDISQWVRFGLNRVSSDRAHSLNDAIFIPGLKGGGYKLPERELKISHKGTEISLKDDGQVIIYSASSKVKIKGDLEVDGKLTTSDDVSVQGKVEASGDVQAGLISLQNHTHIGNLGSPTSPPVS